MKYLYLIVGLFINTLGIAQKKNVYFLKNDNSLVASKDNADFIRIVTEPDSGSKFYNVLEYYPKGQKKRFVKSSKIEPALSLEGTCVDFYLNGKRKTAINYINNAPAGEAYAYFSNGKPYTILDYGIPDKTRKNDNLLPDDPLVKICNDSTGKALVIDGTGHYPIYNLNTGKIKEEGDVKNGRKIGEWKGQDEDLKIKFTETYENGKLVSGSSTDSAGTYTYKERMVNAQYKGGVERFGHYLSKQIIYPENDRRSNIQGRVYISFVIGKSGQVKNVKVLRSVSPGIDAEAMRVINNSKEWLPGVAYGRTVSSLFTVPIMFALGN